MWARGASMSGCSQGETNWSSIKVVALVINESKGSANIEIEFVPSLWSYAYGKVDSTKMGMTVEA